METQEQIGPMNKGTKINYFNTWVRIKGTAPRCRKIDRHLVDLVKQFPINYSAEQLEELKNKAKAIIAKYKNVSSAELHLSYTTHEVGSYFEQTELFDKRHQDFKLI